MVLSRCLESIKDIVDEIIIIDTGSTDKTKVIARQYTDKVYDFRWTQDFSQARNYSFSKATKDYQMWLDADDIITKENKEKILKLKEDLNPNIDIVTFKYNTHFDKDNNPILTSTRGRLFKREKIIYGMILYTNTLNLEVIYITPTKSLYLIKKKLPIQIEI